MKKLFTFFLTFVMAIMVSPNFAVIANAQIVLGFLDGLKYEQINPNEVAVTGYDNNAPSKIVIPEMVEFDNVTYTVTQIAPLAFFNNYSLEEITIADTVKDIGEDWSDTFFACVNLKALNLGAGLERFNKGMFTGCVALEQITANDNPNFTVANGNMLLSGDGKTLIYACSAVTGDVTIPDSVEVINEEVFRRSSVLVYPDMGLTPNSGSLFRNDGIDSVTFNDSLKEIKSSAFYGNPNIKKVIIPDSVITIGDGVFDYCPLENIVIGKSVEYIGVSSFRVFETTPNTTITFRRTTPPVIQDQALPYAIAGMDKVKVYVPRGTKQAYQNCLSDYQYYNYEFIEYDLEKDTPTTPVEPEEPNTPNTPNNNPSEPNTTGSSSSSGSSRQTSSDNPPSPSTSNNVSPNGLINQSNILKELAQEISKNTGNTVILRSKNASSILPATLKALASASSKSGKKAIVHADTMSTNNQTVEGRLYIEPEKFSNMNNDLKLGVYTRDAKTNARKTIFKKWFKNELEVVSCDQQGSFDAKIEIAVKLDLSKLNIKSLIFYSYDKATNSYSQIIDPSYYIDNSGYLHFYTDKAGDIIITDKALEHR